MSNGQWIEKTEIVFLYTQAAIYAVIIISVFGFRILWDRKPKTEQTVSQ